MGSKISNKDYGREKDESVQKIRKQNMYRKAMHVLCSQHRMHQFCCLISS